MVKKITKKTTSRIKARIRKNREIINRKITNFFDWIKGAELIELTECNISEDPVRPELDNEFRTNYGRKILITFLNGSKVQNSSSLPNVILTKIQLDLN